MWSVSTEARKFSRLKRLTALKTKKARLRSMSFGGAEIVHTHMACRTSPREFRCATFRNLVVRTLNANKQKELPNGVALFICGTAEIRTLVQIRNTKRLLHAYLLIVFRKYLGQQPTYKHSLSAIDLTTVSRTYSSQFCV